MNNKGNTVVYVLVVLVVVGILVYITINKKTSLPVESQLGQATDSPIEATDMENSQEVDVQRTDSQKVEGVKITILSQGTGAVAKDGDTVAMNYTGSLINGVVFDSNVDPKFGHVQPFVFTIGAGMVIKGWDVGIAGMKIGEKRKLEIESAYAYGPAGAGEVIPPNAQLNFEVELLAIKP